MLQEEKEQAAVDALYEEIFLDAFISQDDDQIDKSNYCRVVGLKLEDDQQLRSRLINQFDRIVKDSHGKINEGQVKQGLHKILKKQIKQMRADESGDDDDNLIGGQQAFTDGAYAKDTIEQILSSFKGSTVLGDDETFIQMSDLLEIFYGDPDMNRELTKVRGIDFCEMLGLFFDLTDRIRSFLLQQVEGQEKLQTDYDALLAKQRKS